MNFKIEKSALNKYLKVVSRMIDDNNAHIIRQGICIKVLEKEIQLIGSDEEISIKARIAQDNKLEIYETGQVVINAKLFRQMIDKSEKDIQIVKNKNILLINSNNTKYQLPIFNSQEYPYIDFSASGSEMILDYKEFKRLFTGVSSSTEPGDDKPQTSSIHISVLQNVLTMGASDSWRLSYAQTNVNTQMNKSFVIKEKHLKRIWVDELGERVQVYVNDNELCVKNDNLIIKTKLASVMYIDFSKHLQQLDQSQATTIEIKKSELNNLLNKVIQDSSVQDNKITLQLQKNKLTLKSQTPAAGIMESSTEDFLFKGLEQEIDINNKFLTDAIKTTNETISLSVGAEAEHVFICNMPLNGIIHYIATLTRR